MHKVWSGSILEKVSTYTSTDHLRKIQSSIEEFQFKKYDPSLLKYIFKQLSPPPFVQPVLATKNEELKLSMIGQSNFTLL